MRPYWQPAIRPELVPAKEEDVFEQTRSLVERAVLNRCSKRKSLGVMYSGGLDSSVLVGVAAQVLKKSNRSVIALSAVNDERHGSIADERSYMAALSGLDNLHIEYVGASGQGPFDDLNKPDRFDTTCIRYSRAFLDDALQDRAASLGVDVLFSGEFGEATISANPSPHVLECAVRLRWATMVQELRGYAKRSGRSPFWHLGAEAWRQVVPKALSDPTYYLSPDLLKAFPPVPLPAYPLWPDTRQTKLADTLRMRLCDVYMSTRDPELVFSPTKPFKDKNLLEFCLALPAKFKSRNGVGRYLLRRSFAGLLPEKIISRPGKLPYSPDYFSRYEEQLPAAVEFVRSIRKSDPVRDVVDVDRLSAAVNRALPLQPRDRPAIASIPNTIYLIQFLRHFSAFRV